MPFGLSSTGFELKRLEDIQSDLISQMETTFGHINTDPDSVFGQLIGVMSKSLADLWELAEAVYNSQYPASASGVALDNVSDLIGVKRLGAIKTTAVIQATGTQGVLLLAGRIVSSSGSGDKFLSVNNTTIDKAAAVQVNISVTTVADSTDYTVTINGTLFTYNSGVSATAISIAAGVVAAITAGSEPVVATDNLDGTFIVDTNDISLQFSSDVTTNMTIGVIVSNVDMVAELYGPISAVAGTLTSIETPVSGWSSASNALDGTVGRDVETDAELRLRRQSSLQIGGSATVNAIRSRLLQVTNVAGATVLENTDSVTDSDGRPPHSFEAIVGGGTDQDVADAIFDVKPAGIEAYGSVVVPVTDSQGISHNIGFSRATEIYVHVKATITLFSEETYPADGDTQVTDKILEYGNSLDIGEDVIPQRFFGYIYQVAGFDNVLVEIATSATPGGPPGSYSTTNLAISLSEVASFDSTRVTIVTV